ncbi:hypothetical protein PYW07_013136 [Mythimna separata]|uniref:proline--tRNA ligase n=1 Tax=Mythimna separata TaxID=271217 RepID=A0AAD7Y649_MYTSE|nr:hypothetical protein PYW07_013136 [Mythimna separata]
MRYLSRLFQPVITIPKNAKIKNTEITCKSQKLLLECGLIRPTSAGLFTILPLARRALDKLELQIRSCIEAAGGQRMSVPSVTAASLWERTGRLHDIGPELMKMEDRHGKKYLLAPTHEEAIADLLADVGPLSYKQLPLLLYQISNKYRDEHRPKHGLLRAREFSMLDAYGIHASEDCALTVYRSVTEAYAELFRRLHLPVHRVSAPSGDMGGSLSHEWQLPAPAGEDQLATCPRCGHGTLDPAAKCEQCAADTETRSSVEVRCVGDQLASCTRCDHGTLDPAAKCEQCAADTETRSSVEVRCVGDQVSSCARCDHGTLDPAAKCEQCAADMETRSSVEVRCVGDQLASCARCDHGTLDPAAKCEKCAADMETRSSVEVRCVGDQLVTCARCDHGTLDPAAKCEQCAADMETRSSVEVGHTFILGSKYSEPLSALYTPSSGAPQPLIMSCYGIGVTRLLAASLEALSSEKSLRWPAAIAPYSVIIIGPKEGSKEWQSHGVDAIHRLYDRLSQTHEDDVIIDDRHHLTIGKRLMMADRMGYPHIVVIGKASLESPARYEVYHSTSSLVSTSVQLLTEDELVALLSGGHRGDDVLIQTSA